MLIAGISSEASQFLRTCDKRLECHSRASLCICTVYLYNIGRYSVIFYIYCSKCKYFYSMQMKFHLLLQQWMQLLFCWTLQWNQHNRPFEERPMPSIFGYSSQIFPIPLLLRSFCRINGHSFFPHEYGGIQSATKIVSSVRSCPKLCTVDVRRYPQGNR